MILAVPCDASGCFVERFEAAEGFFIFEDDHHGKLRRTERTACPIDSAEKIAVLREWGVDALLCGKVESGAALSKAGVMLFSGLSGEPRELALAFWAGTLSF